MSFFDNLKNSSIGSTVTAVAGSVQTIDNYLQNDDAPSLVSIGAAAAGNLSPAQIAAGLTGSPSQPSVVPSSVPAAAIQNASPTHMAAKAGMSGAMVLIIAAAAYFLVFKKRG